jgi:molybdopterin synthase catalytic subunit
VTSLPAHSLKDAETVVDQLKHDKNRTCVICMTGYVRGTDKSYVIPVELITEMYDQLTKPPSKSFAEITDDIHYNYDEDRARAAEAATY